MASESTEGADSTPQATSFREADIDASFVRISKLAVGASVIALISLFALLTTSMLAFCWIAALLGLVAAVRIARDPDLGGLPFALTAIIVGSLIGSWSLTVSRMQAAYLYRVAGEHAHQYLQVLAGGDTMYAMELQKVESERQITGTRLDLVYGVPESEAAQELEMFLKQPATKVVLASGKDSNWQPCRRIKIEHDGLAREVTLEMADQTNAALEHVIVKLRRWTGMLVNDEGAPTTLWNVVEERLANE